MNKVVRYFRDVWAEIHKITWPSRREIALYTGVVIVAVAVVTLVVWVADSIFSLLFRFLFSL